MSRRAARLEYVSTRGEPTLGVSSRAMAEQLFKDLEFERFNVPCLEPIEMAAEKVRAGTSFEKSGVSISTNCRKAT